jgi:hypothetical protein
MSLLDHLSLVNHTSAFKAASAHATLMPLATFLQRAEESGKTFSWAMGAAMDALHRHFGQVLRAAAAPTIAKCIVDIQRCSEAAAAPGSLIFFTFDPTIASAISCRHWGSSSFEGIKVSPAVCDAIHDFHSLPCCRHMNIGWRFSFTLDQIQKHSWVWQFSIWSTSASPKASTRDTSFFPCLRNRFFAHI